jgi:hypothetical protein
MGVIILSCLLSGGIGLIAGGYYSMLGWVIAANLLILATVIAAFATSVGLLHGLGWAVLVILAFNGGLALGLYLRTVARTRIAAAGLSKTKTLLDR